MRIYDFSDKIGKVCSHEMEVEAVANKIKCKHEVTV